LAGTLERPIAALLGALLAGIGTAQGATPPLRFIEMRGQSDPVAYSVRAGETTVSFTGDGVTFSLGGEGRRQRSLKLDFVGARATHPVGEDFTRDLVDGTCGRLVYRELWPGIDLVYTGDEGRLKYSFVVRPGADPGRIQLAYRGASGMRVTSDGRLAVSTLVGSLEEERPYAYQETGAERIEVKAAFALSGDDPYDTRFGFRVGSYDVSRPLILDPVIKLIGFETRNPSEIASLGAGATITAATVRPGSGVRSLNQAATASVLATGLTPALDTLGLRFSFRKPSNPGADQTLLLFTTGATNQWALQLRTDGRLQVQDLATLTFVGSALGSTAMANATWYTVRLAYDRAAGGVLQVWLDASLEISITHTAAGTAVDQIQVLAAAAVYNYDDFYLTNTASQPPLGQIVRIGVNGGSLNQELVVANMQENTDRDLGKSSEEIINECMVLSAVQSTELALESGLRKDQIIISCKTSRPRDLIAVYRDLARKTDQPLHLGLTEAGMGLKGLVWSSAAMSVLLSEGIGDTIRVSLTPRPGGDRREEVYAACELLQSLGLRAFAPSVTACPGCGRTTSTTFQELAERIQRYIRERMPEWRRGYDGVESMTLAVMGCIVNGPGESRAANIGISLPGTGEAPNCPVYIDGKHVTTLRGTSDELAEGFRRLVEEYVERTYARTRGAAMAPERARSVP